ncbi:MAG: PIN domain-containing protein [Nevskiaceae bacterium]|jgi:predicted nucleic acid-binding protein|nr:PIN domain-containing protein [Nevskiaceae bacterium]
MPTSVEGRPVFAVDTSVAIAALDAGHAAHTHCRERVMRAGAALAGHAAFETYSVLTRMPGPLRMDAPSAAEILRTAFPRRCGLSPAACDELLARCGVVGIVGGAIYDALVGEASRVNGCTLLTRDRRAQRTYDLLGVPYQLMS